MKHLLKTEAMASCTNPVSRSVGGHIRLKSILKGAVAHLVVVGLVLSCSLTTWGQQSAVVSESSGNRVFMEVSTTGLRSDLDTLYARIANFGQVAGAAATLTWSDVLTNGGNPGGDVNFTGYDALGLANVSASGTMTVDSISVTRVINGQVDDLSNHDSDNLPEGSTHLFFTAAERLALTQLLVTMDSLIAVVDAIQNPGPGATAPTVSTSAASDVAETGATLNGSIDSDGGDAITATGFRWGQAANLSDAQDLAGSTTSGSFTGSLTGLAAGTTYYFSAFATNGEGTSHGDTLSFTTSAAASAGFTTCGDDVTYQGYDYATVQIGSQCWFAENLQSTSYNDDTTIPTGLDGVTWSGTALGAVAMLNDDPLSVAASGRLYNWHAVNTGLLCPTGWHVPSDDELTALTDQIGDLSIAATALKASATDSPSWDGSNSSGFSAVPGGIREANGTYGGSGWFGYLWSSTVYGNNAWYRRMYTSGADIARATASKKDGLNVRCIQDATASAAAPTVSTSAASDMAETGATLNGSISDDGGDAITATGFRWGQAANLSDAQDLAGSATSGSFTGSLTGLAAGTTYYFSAFATNGEGTSHGDTLSFTTTAAAAFSSCGDSYNHEGHNYATVQIGSQCWFAENLQSSSYNDGTAIPTGLDDATWAGTAIGAVAAYNDDEANVATSGRLYNWYAVNTGLLCPTGWHVPLNAEFNALATELGGTSSAGEAMKSSSSDSPAWNGTNTSAFSAVLTGVKEADGTYDEATTSSYMWASDVHIGGSPQWWVLYTFHGTLVSSLGPKNYGLPVRCLKD